MREERERQYAAEQRSCKTTGAKVCDNVRSHVSTILILFIKGRAKDRAEADDDDAGSVDSMAMEVDEPGSDFVSDIGPSSAKKAGTSRGKRATTSTVTGKKAASSRTKHMVS